MVLLRHGESIWNLENRFTGWTDIDLTEKGKAEAKAAGQLFYKNGIEFDIVYTSMLKRAKHTLSICLKQMNIKNIPIKNEWRLNERHYGSLQGLNKSEMAAKYGEKQVFLWRRSYDVLPPLLEPEDERHPKFDPTYQSLNQNDLPMGECLKDTVNRVMPLWKKIIVPKILSDKRILIVAHGNSLRAIVKVIDEISDKEIAGLNIPTGVPLIYELDNNLKAIKSYYLGDSNDIQERLANVVAQGNSN